MFARIIEIFGFGSSVIINVQTVIKRHSFKDVKMADLRQFNFNVRSVVRGVDPISLASIVVKKLTEKENHRKRRLETKL